MSIGDEILLSLFHCKYSSKDESGARLSDLYEVCGQAQRSIRWKHLKLSYLYNHVKHREKLWRKKGYSRFLKGDMASFSSVKNKARTTPINFSISIIQPGVQKNIITEEMLKLLESTALYIKKTTMAELIVVGS